MEQRSSSIALTRDHEVELVHWLRDVGQIIKSVNSRCRAADAGAGEILQPERPYGQNPDRERAVATVLFTDIVGSTEKAAQLGDAVWRDLLAEFQRRAGSMLDRFHGRLVDTAGDGVFAVFNGPTCAVRCALHICTEAAALGLRTRAGVHVGEVERLGRKFGGIAVHIGARIMNLAACGEVLVSSTVKDIAAGSGLQFEDRGTQMLKGLPDKWHLYIARRD
ncbi:MAG TPA: adenylate/guanylate cyclase domain-containing protein [Burkholderiales bacterium]|nr:adenylate/guanylate cyclase domain-containing protein [Burkholderiales bacterium]